jgi:hypothetical protein
MLLVHVWFMVNIIANPRDVIQPMNYDLLTLNPSAKRNAKILKYLALSKWVYDYLYNITFTLH